MVSELIWDFSSGEASLMNQFSWGSPTLRISPSFAWGRLPSVPEPGTPLYPFKQRVSQAYLAITLLSQRLQGVIGITHFPEAGLQMGVLIRGGPTQPGQKLPAGSGIDLWELHYWSGVLCPCVAGVVVKPCLV